MKPVSLIDLLYGVQRRFLHYFSNIAADNALIHAFLEFFLLVLLTIFFTSHWLLSHITIIETMDSSKRGMNPMVVEY